MISTAVASKHSRQIGSNDSTEDNNGRMHADSIASDGSAVRGWNEKEQIWDDWVQSWDPTEMMIRIWESSYVVGMIAVRQKRKLLLYLRSDTSVGKSSESYPK